MGDKTTKAASVSRAKKVPPAYFRLRIHDDVLDRVRDEAEQNYRSMTAEITCILAEHFSRKDAQKKRRT